MKRLFGIILLLAVLIFVSCDENQQLIINPETPTPTVRGTVSIPEAAGLSGSDFYVRIMEGEKAVYTGKVKADGSFSVSGLSEEATYSILLTTEEPGDIKGSERAVSKTASTSGYGGWLSNVTASINEQAGVGSIKVKPLGTIKGVVKKDGAEDNYDTTVYIPGTSYLSMTDGEGNFSLFNVPQATYTLRYISNGYMAKMVENVVLYSESDTENPVTTVQRQTLIKNAGNLIGTISKTGSSDHSNITIMLSDGENVYTGSTGTDGSLMITGILPGTYSATISASGFITQTVESIKIEAAKNTTINPISLTANGGDIKGSVIMNDGGDKAGVLITAKSSDEKYSYTTSTDTEGKFTISNAYPGTYTLTLSKTNYAITTKTGVQSIAGQETNSGVFVFSSDYGTIEGTVKDSKGNAIENAIVKIGEITAFTGSDGKFSKTGIGVGSYTVTISREGYATQTLTQTISVESSKTTSIGTIKLASVYGSITGTVTVNDNGSTVGIDVTATAADGKKTQVKTTSGGAYTIANLTPGNYTISASADGYEIAERTVAVTADSNTDVEALALTSLSGSLKVTVGYADSEETSGITVTLYNSEDQKLYETTTTNSLTVTFNGARIGSGYRVTAEAVGYGARAKTDIIISSAQETAVSIPNLSNNCGLVNGTVEDTKGNPIANAIVRIGDITVFTNADGSFAKSGIAVGSYTVTISKDGYTSKTLSDKITVESSKETNIGSISLASMYGGLWGVVTVNDGGSVEGINVSVAMANGSSVQAKTLPDGSYEVEGLVPGTYTVSAESGSYSKATRTVIVNADRYIEVDALALTSLTGSLKVTVGYADNANRKDGITVSVYDSNDRKVVDAITTDSLTVTFTGIAVGTNYRIVAEADNYASSARTGISVLSALETTLTVSSLTNRYGSVSGRVMDTDGVAIANAIVRIGEISVITDTAGYFSKNGIAVGNYTVTVSKDGYTAKTFNEKITVEASEETEIGTVLLASEYGKLTGLVTVNDGAGVAGISVSAISSNGNYSYSTLTVENGSYVITSVQPGTYSITVQRTGYSDATAVVEVMADRTATAATVTLLSKHGSVSGKVSLAESADNSGVTVTLTFAADTTIKTATISGADGTYTFSKLTNAGQYTITFSKDGYVSDTGRIVNAILGQNTTVEDVTLRSLTSTVSGKITLEGTEDYTGISVLLKATDNSVQFDATTDQQGNYVMARVNPGEYTLTVSKAGFVSKTVSDIIVESSTEKTLDSVFLNIGTRSVTGNVTLELKTDYSGALISATNLSNPKDVYSAISNTAGDYTLAGMKPGEYVISVSCAGYNTATLPTINITEGTERTLDSFELKIARGTIAGLVRIDGYSDYSGVTVKLLGSNYETITDVDGSYEFSVPSANYPGGLRFEKEDIKTASHTTTITVLTNSTYAVPDVHMTVDNVQIVHGVFVLKESSNHSGVKVYLEEAPEYYCMTDEDGVWQIEHVPIGEYTLVAYRENVKSFNMPVSLTASQYYDNGELTLIPNAASITGFAKLDNMTSFGNILVTAESLSGESSLSTYTKADGSYYLSNLVSTADYTVTYSKSGWKSSTIVVGAFENLEIRELEDVVLSDMTAPSFSSLVINNGASTTASRVVTLHINAEDFGSGISKVQINTENRFDETVTYRPYDSSIEYELPETNGEKVLFVKLYDKCGNGSGVLSARVTLVDQKYEVSGPLYESADLHWTKENSPYLVTGDIMVEEGYTLTIDPGVDVQFAGPFSITIEGTIHAVGTDEEKISFYGIDNGEGTWKGIYCASENLCTMKQNGTFIPEYLSGNILSHIYMYNNAEGITGQAWVSDSLFIPSQDIIGRITEGWNESHYLDYHGIAFGSKRTVKGSKYGAFWLFDGQYERIGGYDTSGSIFSGVIINSSIYGDCLFTSFQESLLIANSEFHGHFLLWSYNPDFLLLNNVFEAFGKTILFRYAENTGNASILNCSFAGYEEIIFHDYETYEIQTQIENDSFVNINRIEFSAGYDDRKRGGGFFLSGCNIDNVDSIYVKMVPVSVNYSNLLNVNNVIINTSRFETGEYDLKNNYWGPDKTALLNAGGERKNYSFIRDYYDSPSEYSKVVYSNWANDAYTWAGYKGNSYLSVSLAQVFNPSLNATIDSEYNITANGDYSIKVSKNEGVSMSRYAFSTNITDFEGNDYYDKVDWIELDNDSIIRINANDYISYGLTLKLFIQIMDSESNVSSIVPISVSITNACGPAGGYIIYDKGEVTDGWRFIELSHDYLRLIDGIPSIDSSADGYSSSQYEFCFGFYREDSTSDNLYVNGTSTYSDGATSRLVGTSDRNTRLLVEAMGSEAYLRESGPDKTPYYAARLCNTLEYEVDGIVYSDWYLPSDAEVNLMYDVLYSHNYGGICYNRLWSSSERIDKTDGAYNIHFFDGWMSDVNLRSDTYPIRPVRYF